MEVESQLFLATVSMVETLATAESLMLIYKMAAFPAEVLEAYLVV